MTTKIEPIELLRTEVKPEWLDYNRHMNAGFYAVAFNSAVESFLEKIGLDESYAKSGRGTTFALECHLTYQRELEETDPIRVTGQLLDYDEKKFHLFLRMFHAEGNFLAATHEHISIYVDLETRKPAPMPESALEKLEHLHQSHRELPPPPEVGRVIGIRRRG
jgi:acyl-CoA thioester hydrolase